MKELIESLEEIKKELNTKWDGDPLARRGIVIAINEAANLLDKEKEQIDSSFKAGMDYAEFSFPPNFNNEWEEYYNQTYNQEPKKEYQPSEKYLKKQKELMEDFIWNKMKRRAKL